MSPILALLQEMRGRLGMYTGTTSITKLAAFLRGYQCALIKMDVKADCPFLSDFRDWIQTRYHNTKVGWENLILQDSKDEGDAVDHFWRLLDEFLATHPEHGAGATSTVGVPLAATGIRQVVDTVTATGLGGKT